MLLKFVRQTLLSFGLLGMTFLAYGKLNFDFLSSKIENKILSPYDDADYRKQLYSFVDWLPFGTNKAGERILYKAQAAGENFLYLGPNEVFFTPPGKLAAAGTVKNSDMDLNQGKEFSFVKGLTRVGDALEWSFLTTNSGNIQGETYLSFGARDVGSVLAISLDDKDPIDLVLTQSMVDKNLALTPIGFDFGVVEPGVHKVKIELKKLSYTTIQFYNNRLSGTAIEGSHVVRERWRPHAGYVRWHSKEHTGHANAWIFELSSSSELGHFSPMSTSFGYYGPVFNPGGTVSGVNFSVWSYGAGQPMPPIYKLSHLLAIGSSKGRFSGYGHEGTGVKVRDWNIFDNNKTGTYVIGLRFKNDGIYTTYYGYFWNISKSNWQLFTIGRKYRSKPLNGLSKFSFIEVPGVAEKQRSNHKPRTVKYRGWVRNKDGNWFEINRMESVVGNREITNVQWDVRSDRRFQVSAGGLPQRIRTDIPRYKDKDNSTKLPSYMSRRKLKKFFRTPKIPVISGMTYLTDKKSLKFVVKTFTRKEVKVTLCWGEKDALTLEKFWDHCKEFTKASGTKNFVTEVSAIPEEKFARVLVRDGSSQMWSFSTKEISTVK